MNPEDILRDLRDIHLPDAAAAPAAGWAPGPLLVFFAIVVGLLALRLLRRQRWRLDARRRLRGIDALPDPGLRWQGMIALLREVAGHVPAGRPPDAAFRPPRRVTPADAEALGGHLRRLLRR